MDFVRFDYATIDIAPASEAGKAGMEDDRLLDCFVRLPSYHGLLSRWELLWHAWQMAPATVRWTALLGRRWALSLAGFVHF
ncbi:hypothetical protein CaCOL14_006883 [Colletotrichum acutatum]